ncbi:DUF2523 family protein [Acinetobacter sp. neg1]|uniref:DUF2523 family protein n=1 Tax=Acinetobacter sp. neg1 TaxID=1561068 RepID=UPI00064593BA|nr:DUF2523 family protein [Acinetobacter sp. neg1]
MNFLFQALMWIGSFFLSSFLKRILAGAGIGIISFMAQQVIYSQFLNYLQGSFKTLHALTLIMFDLSGLSISLSLVVSSVGIRMTMNSGKLAFRKI